LILGLAIASVARWKHALTASGAIAAIAVAAATWSAGWTWGAIVIAFFVTSTLLSRLGGKRKQATLGDIVEKGNARDWKQVVANGGIFAAAAVASLIYPHSVWMLAGGGAIAASTADTWATEIGTLSSTPARSIITRKEVPAGTSGGVTLTGTIAAIGGAAFIGLITFALGWSFTASLASFTAGFAASMLDSVLGATLQCRKWCARCERGTERAVHGCGTTTTHAGGIAWLDNDMVNLLSSLSGALIGAAFAL
jgi:uncharacterized protein (TIGR00297 family)